MISRYKRKAIAYCPHGCGRVAKFRFKNGNSCCESNIAKCPAIRAKNSASSKGKGHPHSEETKQKIRLANLGKKVSEETKEKMRGPKSEEHKRKLSESRMGIEPWNKGKKNIYSDETKAAMQKSWFKKGNKPYNKGKARSEETRKKISESHKGLKFSLETRQKLSKIRTGRKHLEKTKLKMSLAAAGPNSSQWKGGISCEPYCDIWQDKDYKESIKERDRYVCQNSDCWGKDKKLTIHHIDYDKKNCIPSNLITLCSSCNSRANANRDFWKERYSQYLNERIEKCA